MAPAGALKPRCCRLIALAARRADVDGSGSVPFLLPRPRIGDALLLQPRDGRRLRGGGDRTTADRATGQSRGREADADLYPYMHLFLQVCPTFAV